MMETPPIQINSVYAQLFGDDGTLRKDIRYFDIWGGRRSAKSHDIVQAVGLTAMQEPRHFIPCFRKVAASLKDSIWAELLGFFREHNIPHRENISDKEILLPNGSRFRCFGLDDPEKLKSLKGPTIELFEEANEFSEDDIDSLDAGLSPSNYPGRQIYLHNPLPQIPGSMTWLQKRYETVPQPLGKAIIYPERNALVLRTWYKNNRWCPKETRKVLEGYKDTNPEKYKLWALGEYTKLEGCVFTKWDTVASVPDGIDCLGVGLDFGYSNDPSAAARVWIREGTREIWIKELVYKTGLYNDALYHELVAAGVEQFESIIADSARPDIIDDLYRMGLNGLEGVKKHSGYKEDVATRIQGYTIHLMEGDTDAIREFSTYSWARDKNGKQLPKLQDGEDHLCDCLTMVIHEKTGEVSMLDVI